MGRGFPKYQKVLDLKWYKQGVGTLVFALFQVLFPRALCSRTLETFHN